MRNKIDYGNNMLCMQLRWAERTDRCCCTTISDAEYEKDRCRIANAYIQGGRIANPTEQIISSGSHWYYTPDHYNTFYRIK